MKMTKNINAKVWEYLELQDTKIAKRILDALNYDICLFYKEDDNSITIERTWSGAVIPNYLFNYIVKHNNKIIKFAEGL